MELSPDNYIVYIHNINSIVHVLYSREAVLFHSTSKRMSYSVVICTCTV